MKKAFWGIAGVLAALAILFGGIAYLTSTGQVPLQEEPEPQSSVITLTIEGVYANKEAGVAADETLLQLLERLNSENPALQLATKNYPGLGTLVESMGELVNGTDGKYWQYFVNGVLAPVGADQYVPQLGDKVEWKFVVPEAEL